MNIGEKLEHVSVPKAFVIGLLVAAGYYVVLFDDGSRQQREINQTKGEISRLKSEEKRIEEAIEDAKRLAIVEEKLGGTLDKILKFIPQNFDSTEMLQLLSKAASETGASIDNLKPGRDMGNFRKKTDNEKNFLEEIRVEVSLTGNFGQIMMFLANLTQVEKIITIEKVSMRSKGGNETDNLLNFKGTFVGHKFSGPGGEQ